MNKLLLIIFLFISVADGFAFKRNTLNFSRFGKVWIYQNGNRPESIILFVSGNKGWNRQVSMIAKSFTQTHSLVVGVNFLHYLKSIGHSSESCVYPAADFENLSKFIQKRFKIEQYSNPVLVGYSSGASLVYGTLAQAPDNTFKGAIGLGFSPDLKVAKLFCKGEGLKNVLDKNGTIVHFQPCNNLNAPFIVLQGMQDKTNEIAENEKFINQTRKGELVKLPLTGSDFNQQSNWFPQMLAAYKKIIQHFDSKEINAKPSIENLHIIIRPSSLNQLPIHVTPAVSDPNKPLVFFISGDGGWTSFDQSLANHFAQKHIPCVGLDALHYFWSEKNPQKVASDVAPIIQYYMRIWGKSKILLVGYSFGADVMPFVANKLPFALKDKIEAVTLLSPSEKADFEIHVSDMLSFGNRNDVHNVIEEIKLLKYFPTLCIFGKDEETKFPEKLREKNIHFLITQGGHHFSNSFDEIMQFILKEM